MATNTRDESIPQRLTSGRKLPFYLGYTKSHGENYIHWLYDCSIYQHDFRIPGLQSLVKELKAPNGLWKSTRKILRFVISSEDECPEWYPLAAVQHLVDPFFDVVFEEVFTEPMHPKMRHTWPAWSSWTNQRLTKV